MNIILKINGEDKTFVMPYVSARAVRTAFAMQKKLENINEDTLDEMFNFVVDCYGKQFTLDELYDGIEAKKLMATLVATIKTITGQMGES